VTKSRAGIGGSACAASIGEGARLPLVTCPCRCAAIGRKVRAERAVLRATQLGFVTVSRSRCGFAVITNRTLILGELSEY
jgi:ribosome modulation factor